MTTSAVTTDTPTRAHGVELTAEATTKVKALLAGQPETDLVLRIQVEPGGCSGLRYQLYFDNRSLDGDLAADFDGVSLVTDKMSAPYLSGAVIDYVDTISDSGFKIENPSATSSCACGDSFN